MLEDKLAKLKALGRDELSDTERDAKMSILDELKSQASDKLGSRLKGLKEVTVASTSEEGLKEGLGTAEELLGESEESEEGSNAPKPYMEEEEENLESLSPEEIDMKIQELLELKRKKEALS